MKKNVFFLMGIILMFALASCQKDNETTSSNDGLSAIGVDSPTVHGIKSMSEYMVTPKFGKPSSTYYSFKVLDVTGTTGISVKLYEKATGTITYLPMTKIGTYWTLSTKITINGWYDWRYVYSVSKANISTNSYSLCNSKNTFSATGVSSISWPFGADGSSYGTRNGWIGGEELNGCGSGWNENGHHYFSCGADDTYAEDWNKNCSTSYADDGATIRSPLDGKVIKVMIDSPSNHNGGYGNAIDIEQEDVNGNKYVFRIAHLKYAPPLSTGNYVRAGTTKIGNIGMTGGTSTAPHGHCVLYNSTGGCNAKSKFLFNAQ